MGAPVRLAVLGLQPMTRGVRGYYTARRFLFRGPSRSPAWRVDDGEFIVGARECRREGDCKNPRGDGVFARATGPTQKCASPRSPVSLQEPDC